MRLLILFILTAALRAEAMDLSGIEIRELPVSPHEMTLRRWTYDKGTKKERVVEIWEIDNRREVVFEAQCIQTLGPEWHYSGAVSQGTIHNIICSRRDYTATQRGVRTIESELVMALRKIGIGRDFCINRLRRALSP